MSKKIQAIIKIDDVPIYYFYDNEIERMLTHFVKLQLGIDKNIKTELNLPPLKFKKND